MERDWITWRRRPETIGHKLRRARKKAGLSLWPMDFPKEFRNVINSYIRGNAGKYLIASYSRTACDIIESQAEQLKEWQERQQWYHDKACELSEQLTAKDKEIERLKKEIKSLRDWDRIEEKAKRDNV